MTRCFTLIALISLFTLNGLAADKPQTAPAEQDGMRRIFNGKDLSGWDGDPKLWSVKDGAIRGEIRRLQVFIVFGLGFDA